MKAINAKIKAQQDAETQAIQNQTNIDKAKALGKRLAKIRPDCKKLGLDIGRMPAAELYCVRVLLTFTAEYAVQKYVLSDTLIDAVSASMYDYLKAEETGYYNNISDGSAFTFYLLALKKSGDTGRSGRGDFHRP